MTGVALGSMLPGTADAVSVADFRCSEQEGNILRYDCTVETTTSESVRIKFWEDGTTEFRYSAATPAGTDHEATIWGLKPGTRYRYTVESGGVDAPTTRFFTTDELGEEFGPPFADLEIRTSTRPSATPWTEYVLVNLNCGSATHYYIVFDTDGNVVWYDAPDQNQTIVAFNTTAEDTIIGITGSQRLHELAWDGTRLNDLDMGASGECDDGRGPCPHHDIIREGGSVWAVTSRVSEGEYDSPGLSGCEEKDDFIVDGFHQFDDTGPWSTLADWRLDEDFGYTPDADMGPNYDPAGPSPRCAPNSWNDILGLPDGSGGFEPPIDYTHINAFHVEGDTVYLSIFNWSQVLTVDAPSKSILWRFHGTDPDYSDFATPVSISPSVVENDTSSISGHHHLSTNADGTFQMYNNQQFPDHTRVLRMNLDTKTWQAEITEVFTMVNDDNGTYVNPSPLTCPQVGSAYNLGDGSRVLAPCASIGSVAELDQNDGTSSMGPVWYGAVTCNGEPVDPPDFYRAIPLDNLDP